MGAKMTEKSPKITKPMGYSHLPHDLGVAPIHWVEKECNLVWSREHKDVCVLRKAVTDSQGGHFPFLEHPVDTFDALEDFVKTAWK
jgi:hypothetical protein